MYTKTVKCLIVLAPIFITGCGHTAVSKIGLLSVGELQGKKIPSNIDGPIVQGKDCGGTFGSPYFLSNAVRAALEKTQYDTILDADVTTTTGFSVYENCVEVKGKAIASGALANEGVKP
jgi:hypothetical protein